MSKLISTITQRRAVLFDFDDTLVATTLAHKPVFWNFIKLIASPPEKALEEIWGSPMSEMLDYLVPNKDKRRLLDTYAAIIELKPPAPLLPGVEDAVRCLSEKGILLIILTSSSRRLVESDLSRHDLLDYFQLIVSSDEAQWVKPDPRFIDPVNGLLKEKGLSLSGTLMVGDSVLDLELARNAGVPFLAVTTGDTRREAFLKENCHDIIGTMEALALACRGRT